MISIEEADLIRGVIISLAALLFSLTVFGTWQAWRQREVPLPRPSFAVTIVWVGSYLLLLIHLVLERWSRIGEPIAPTSWIALLALLGNIVSVFLLVRNAHDTVAVRAQIVSRDYDVAVRDFKRSMKLLKRMNLYHWRELHPGADMPPPMTRYQDQLIEMEADDLAKLVRRIEDRPT